MNQDYAIPKNQGIANNLADSQSSTVTRSMDHRKKLLDLEIGDTIIWRDEGMRNEEGIILISPGMRGKVITRSENLLAGAARKAGLPITAGLIGSPIQGRNQLSRRRSRGESGESSESFPAVVI